MSFSTNEVTFEVPYKKTDCFSVALEVINELNKWRVKSENQITGVIQANVSPGLTSTTWGDVVTVSLNETSSGGTSVTVSSSAKAFSLAAGMQQAKNIDRFVDAFSKKIEQHEKVLIPSSSNSSVADEIMKYKQLLDAGAIAQEEYDAKKKQLLNL